VRRVGYLVEKQVMKVRQLGDAPGGGDRRRAEVDARDLAAERGGQMYRRAAQKRTNVENVIRCRDAGEVGELARVLGAAQVILQVADGQGAAVAKGAGQDGRLHHGLDAIEQACSLRQRPLRADRVQDVVIVHYKGFSAIVSQPANYTAQSAGF